MKPIRQILQEHGILKPELELDLLRNLEILLERLAEKNAKEE